MKFNFHNLYPSLSLYAYYSKNQTKITGTFLKCLHAFLQAFDLQESLNIFNTKGTSNRISIEKWYISFMPREIFQ
jgi:hypothetical protein